MRVHITSSGPRTGSTLIFEEIKRSYNWFRASEHENHIFEIDKTIERYSEDGYGILSKSPRHLIMVLFALMLRRDLFVISVIRDPRDVVLSKHSGAENEYYSDMSFFFRYLKLRNWFFRSSRFLEIRYEDFVTNTKMVQVTIHDFLRSNPKLKNTSERRIFISKKAQNALGGIRPIDNTSVGKWKNPKFTPIIHHYYHVHGEHLASGIRLFGYEKFEIINPRKLNITALKSVKGDDRKIVRNFFLLIRSFVFNFIFCFSQR